MSTTPRSTLDKFSDALTQSEKRVIGVIVLLLAANLLVRFGSGNSLLPETSLRHTLRDAERKEFSVRNREPVETQVQHPRKIFPIPGSLDINLASREELMRLPGVGPSMAERIITVRAERAFVRRNDLRRVRGIGAKRLAEITPYLTLTK